MKKLAIGTSAVVLSTFLLVSFTNSSPAFDAGMNPVASSKDKGDKDHKGHKGDKGKTKGKKGHHDKHDKSSTKITIKGGDDLKISIKDKDKGHHKSKHGKPDEGHHGNHHPGHPGHDNGKHKGHYKHHGHHHGHHKPKHEKEARNQIRIIIALNKELIIKTGDKITLARKRNQERYDSGGISLTLFKRNERYIESCEERRLSLEVKVKI